MVFFKTLGGTDQGALLYRTAHVKHAVRVTKRTHTTERERESRDGERQTMERETILDGVGERSREENDCKRPPAFL